MHDVYPPSQHIASQLFPIYLRLPLYSSTISLLEIGGNLQVESYSLKEIQAHIKQTEYRPKDKQASFLKLVEEVGELSEAIRKDSRMTETKAIKGTIEEELYDVLYYVLVLANQYGIDMEEAMRLKEEIKQQKMAKRKVEDERKKLEDSST